MRPHLYSPAEDALLIAGYQAGWSHARLAAELQRPLSSIRSRLTRLAEVGRAQRRTARPGRPPQPETGITAEDIAWMAYWRQPRATRHEAQP